MIRFFPVLIMVSTVAADSPGKASAVWLASSAAVEPGQQIHTAIRLVHDAPWHTYWINPGESGMVTRVDWKLPPGWKSSGLLWPVPIRFQSSGLAGFGYEGTTWFPVTLTAPSDFVGDARLFATLSWLACSEEGCVPGEAELQLDLRAGKTAATENQAAILQAHERLPRVRNDLRLVVREEKDSLVMTISPVSGAVPDLSASQVFPATPNVVAADAVPIFKKESDQWIATAKLNEYVKKPLQTLVLVLDGGALKTPIQLTWTTP